MTETFRTSKKNFFNFRSRTIAWISNDASHKYPLLEFAEGILRTANKQWNKIKLERASLEPYNDSALFICHECGFIFDDSSAGVEEHQTYHTKMRVALIKQEEVVKL